MRLYTLQKNSRLPRKKTVGNLSRINIIDEIPTKLSVGTRASKKSLGIRQTFSDELLTEVPMGKNRQKFSTTIDFWLSFN